MDWFTTALDLAGIKMVDDRVIDGVSLLPLFVNGTETDRYRIEKCSLSSLKVVILTVSTLFFSIYRPIFYYRGDEMMAVRYQMYKAHYWTWTNSLEEYNQVSVSIHVYRTYS